MTQNMCHPTNGAEYPRCLPPILLQSEVSRHYNSQQRVPPSFLVQYLQGWLDWSFVQQLSALALAWQ